MNNKFREVSGVDAEVKSSQEVIAKKYDRKLSNERSRCSRAVILTESRQTTLESCIKVPKTEIPVGAKYLGRACLEIDHFQLSKDKWPELVT